MVEFIHGDTNIQVSGEGAWDIHFFSSKNSPLVILRCPRCQRVSCLHEHTIKEDGKVFPSVVCPREDCDFHDMVQLKDWKGLPFNINKN